MIQWFIRQNRRASRAFDRILPPHLSVDGNRHFLDVIAPAYIGKGLRIVDVGGGRRPFVRPADRVALELHVTGLDVDARELQAAPSGSYDTTVVADITGFRGRQDADLVVCQAVLEHVGDTAAAFQSLASLVRPGGRILLFVPSRNAVFARANMIIPDRLKRRILFYIYPEAKTGQGFRSYYDRCTPRDFCRMARESGLEVEREWLYWSSAYFTFLVPLHALWRLMQLVLISTVGRQAAETFSMVLRRPC